MTKKQQILALRAQGMKYRQIAAHVGVSFQYAAIVCGQTDISKFRPYSKDDCVFPYLRQQLNTQRVSRNELIRRMGLNISGENNAKLGRILRGEQNPNKLWIDRMISATDLPYEQLFNEEDKSA